jgi:hypothetical protein
MFAQRADNFLRLDYCFARDSRAVRQVSARAFHLFPTYLPHDDERPDRFPKGDTAQSDKPKKNGRNAHLLT